MKNKLLLGILVLLSATFLTSCMSHGAHGANAFQNVVTRTTTTQAYDLDISGEAITYTIDISTAEGQAKLRNLSLREAEDLALREAIIANGCATLFNPQYTNLMKGKRVLRVTVYGFPAIYKNQKR